MKRLSPLDPNLLFKFIPQSTQVDNLLQSQPTWVHFHLCAFLSGQILQFWVALSCPLHIFKSSSFPMTQHKSYLPTLPSRARQDASSHACFLFWTLQQWLFPPIRRFSGFIDNGVSTALGRFQSTLLFIIQFEVFSTNLGDYSYFKDKKSEAL